MPGKKVYIKKNSFDSFNKSTNKAFYLKSALPQLLMFIGTLIFVTQVVIPLTFFESVEDTSLGYISGFKKFEFKELQKSVDLEHSQLTGDSLPEVAGAYDKNNKPVPDKFYITIPKLGIEEALVETNSADLSPDDRLGHYQNSALPGEGGNTFVYGHSVLPVFYNPSNYKTIFSTLNDLVPGDRFFIRYNNKVLSYEVENKAVVKPQDINPIASWKPEYLNQDTVTFMTCWPAGTKFKRLVVNAVRIN